MKDTLHLADPKPRMVAHRGTSGLELENTNSAFVAAGNRSYFGIETDVHRTADGQFILVQWHPEELLKSEPRMLALFSDLAERSVKTRSAI